MRSEAILLFATILCMVRAGINGTTFFVVGDYGDVNSMSRANMVFDAINSVVGASTVDTIGKPEFFVACGDNIYPAVPSAPTTTEF